MKKIKDERLILRNLQNIRVAYIAQTFGIIAILGYDLVTKGLEGMRENPLWLVFMLTAGISAYLSMSISVDNERYEKNPKNGLYLSLIVFMAISVIIGFLVTKTDGYSLDNGILLGGILFFCGLIPSLYIYRLRKKHWEQPEDSDE